MLSAQQGMPSSERKCSTCERTYTEGLEYCPFDGSALTVPGKPAAQAVAGTYAVGQTVADKYAILGPPIIGRHTAVYRARDTQANRVVALKVVLSEHKASKSINTRFQNEGYLLSALAHPHIVSIYDFGITHEQTQFMALKFIEGTSLSDLMKHEKRVEPKRMIVMFTQICAALEILHQKMKIHGALYPHHILLTPTGSADLVTLIDFSRSQSLGIKQVDPPELDYFGDISKGVLFASPEEMTGEAMDDRSDIYALGCVLYQALCGVAPFEGTNGVDVRNKHLSKKPIPPSTVSPGLRLPQHLDAVVMKALEKMPDKRHQTIEKFLRDLRAASAS
ncbi:MAG: serine/threonine protein kinase [Leptolyngbya sp.]|nr:serine/threonine protein kinase [Candidatus Melainabacteria bacterium]